MEIHGMFANGVNVLAISKGGKFYAMTCAWATQIDYDRFIMCIGGQSETNKILEVGDMVGVSALSMDQKQIGMLIGTTHSLETDKMKEGNFEFLSGCYVIPGAKNQLAGKITRIDKYQESPEDKVIQIQVLDVRENKDKTFLNYKAE